MLHNFNALPNIVMVIKSRMMRWAEHVVHIPIFQIEYNNDKFSPQNHSVKVKCAKKELDGT